MTCQQIFQLSRAVSTSIHGKKSSYPGALKSYNFVLNIKIFQSSTLIVITKGFMLYLRSGIFPNKSLLYFFKFICNMFWDTRYKWLKNNFWYRYCFRNNNFPSSVTFLIFDIFNLVEYLLHSYKFFFPLLIFHCKRNEYLIFLMYHYLHLYNVNHRLSLEPPFSAPIPVISDFKFGFNPEKYEKKKGLNTCVL